MLKSKINIDSKGFSINQLLKAIKIIKNNKIVKEFSRYGKIYFKVKNYEVFIDLKRNKESCTCKYFSLKGKKNYCSHIIASYLFLEGDSWLLKNLRKK